MAMQMRKQDIV